jgi:hypothetical protein
MLHSASVRPGRGPGGAPLDGQALVEELALARINGRQAM